MMKNSLNAEAASASMQDMEKRKTVLVAVLGMSPSVLTETVWALHKEKPEYLPDEIHVCSTSTGTEKIDQLLHTRTGRDSTVWLDLKRCVGRDMHINYHVFTDPEDGHPLSDIQDSRDQELVADQLLKVVRDLKNPMQEDCRVACSIAGGRKSMSALMYAVMSLAGDGGDIITHVLTAEDATACPDFFYPDQTVQKLTTRSGKAITAKKVHVELATIPFVPLRSLVGEKQVGKAAGSFSTLVKRARNELDNVKPESIRIRVHTRECGATVNGEPVALRPEAHTLLSIMARALLLRKQNPKVPAALTGGLCGKMFGLLVQEKRLPQEVLRRASSKLQEDKLKLFYSELIAALNNPAQDQQTIPPSINKEKFTLKEDLLNAGLTAVVEDALPNKKMGFQKIHDVDFTDGTPPANPQQAKPVEPQPVEPTKEAKPSKPAKPKPVKKAQPSKPAKPKPAKEAKPTKKKKK